MSEALVYVLGAISFGFNKDPNNEGVLATDEDFKKGLCCSARVVSNIMTAAKATKGRDNGDYFPELCAKFAWTLNKLIKEKNRAYRFILRSGWNGLCHGGNGNVSCRRVVGGDLHCV